MALCLLLSFTALMIHYFFDASAYDVYLPMAAGLCTSVFVTAKPLIEAAERGETAAESEVGSAPPSSAPRLQPGPGEARGRNPYRLGRRRVSSR